MRYVGFTLAVLLCVGSVRAQAQPMPPVQQPPPPPGPGADVRLDAHLRGWELKMKDVSNFYSQFETKRKDAVFGKEKTWVGTVLCMKPNFARLRQEDAANKEDYEAWICNGKSAFEYSGLNKSITEYPLPQNVGPNAPGGSDNLMLDLISGLTVQAAKQRFQITLFKEDENYIYLDIKPLQGKDRQDFEHVRFALYGPNTKGLAYLPAQVWMLKPNGNSELWKFSNVKTDVPGLKPKDFEPVEVKGFQFKKAPPRNGLPVGGNPTPGGPNVRP